MRHLNDAAGLAKAESRRQRAAEEYRQYVEKHAKVTDDFQSKMKTAAATYQVLCIILRQKHCAILRITNFALSSAYKDCLLLSHNCTRSVQ